MPIKPRSTGADSGTLPTKNLGGTRAVDANLPDSTSADVAALLTVDYMPHSYARSGGMLTVSLSGCQPTRESALRGLLSATINASSQVAKHTSLGPKPT